jgi:anti-sigma-K factor RskA
MDYSRPELADRLAAEYVVGTLRGAARRRFEALLPAHANLRTAVTLWQQRLLPMTAAVAPQSPSPAVWQGVQSRLFGAGTVASPSAAPLRAGWWAQLAFWRGLSAAAGVAVLALAVLLANPAPTQPPIVVVLSAATPAAGGGVTPASFVASISGDGRAMVTRPLTQVSLQPDHSLELWSLPAQGAPRSLGVISASGATVVKKNKVLDGTTALAVSLEPPGGSPTGAPTGPVLYVGKLTL